MDLQADSLRFEPLNEESPSIAYPQTAMGLVGSSQPLVGSPLVMAVSRKVNWLFKFVFLFVLSSTDHLFSGCDLFVWRMCFGEQGSIPFQLTAEVCSSVSDFLTFWLSLETSI